MSVKLSVYIEMDGSDIYVGMLSGTNAEDTVFSYADEYLNRNNCQPISISLPLAEQSFSVKQTRIYFEGLLPEGFTRKCVAKHLQADEKDYLSILSVLGSECLGAIKIIPEGRARHQVGYTRLTEQEVRCLAEEGVTESVRLVAKAHLSLTGASGKVGLYYDQEKEQWYLPVGTAPSTHIVKQSHVRLKKIVANEQLCLLTAKKFGIDVPESFIFKTESSSDEAVLFVTKRYDRIMDDECKKVNGLKVPFRLHQEDFSQALGIPAEDKYEKNERGYLQQMFALLRKYSLDPITDQLKLWDIVIFNYLIGNTDNHIKNLSLLYSKDLRTVSLAPAYDIISTVIYESSSENMSVSIGGLYSLREIKRENFAKEAQKVGLGKGIAMKHFDEMVSNFESVLNTATRELEKEGELYVSEIQKQILQNGGIANCTKVIGEDKGWN